MGSQIPNNSRKKTSGRPAKKPTCFAYAAGPLIAVEFETRMCSKRNAPTGTIPESECNRRRRNDVPCPARNGATPCAKVLGTAGAAELADATNTPYEFSLSV